MRQPFSRSAVSTFAPGLSRVVAVLVWIGMTAVESGAQEAVVRMEENFRAEPNGEVLGRLDPGTRIRVGELSGDWTEATVQGFVFIPSLQVWPDSSLDLVVSAPEGENLRVEPAGRVAGRFEEGTRLEEVRRIPGWVEVRRTGWIWTPSIEEVASGAAAIPVGSDSAGTADSVVDGAGVRTATDPGSTTTAPAAGGGSFDAPPLSESTFLSVGRGGTPILGAPDGDTLALAAAGSDLRLLARDGSWARVRVEGWVWMPAIGSESEEAAGDGSTVVDVGVEDFFADPDRYRGRLLRMDLEFISLEEAEQVRTDFYEGEPFLLTRSPGAERRFVYVAVPPDRMVQAESLTPLEGVRIVGRIRSGAAALTGSPILDLVELERLP